MDNKKTLCIWAFDSPNVNFTLNQFRMCCHTGGHNITEQVIETHGTQLFTQLEPIIKMKKDLLMGIQTPACGYCWKIESAGGKSSRLSRDHFAYYIAETNWFGTKDLAEVNKRLDNITEEEAYNIAKFYDEPRLLEISLSNLCDLKCVYCNHNFSSQWAAESVKHNELNPGYISWLKSNKDSNYQKVFWEYFLRDGFKKINYISFIGGEPLIINEFYEYLDLILVMITI